MSKNFIHKKDCLDIRFLSKEIKDLKIIDFKKSSSVIIFFLGKKDLTEYYGDDWDDIPYKDNAGTIYGEYVEKVLIAYYSNNYQIAEADDIFDACYSKLDMKAKIVAACAVGECSNWFDGDMSYIAKTPKSVLFFFDDLAIKILKNKNNVVPTFVELLDKTEYFTKH